MSKKAQENKQEHAQAQDTALELTKLSYEGNGFEHDSLISKHQTGVTQAAEGVEIRSYSMLLKGVGDTEDLLLDDEKAIEAIEGIRLADKLEKYVSYRKGAYLVQLVDSTFMRNNEVKSIVELAKHYEIGVETSTCNALENVARKLNVSFDNEGNMHFGDDTLPKLSFWHYSQIISLVRESDDGGYDYSNLHEFIRLAKVTPLMSQKRLKELFNDYRNNRLEGQSLTLPDNILAGVKRAEEKADKKRKEKEEAEKASRVVSGKVALEKAETFIDKKAVALSAVDALRECLKAIKVDYDLTGLMEVINNAEQPTATPKQPEGQAEDNSNDQNQ